MRIASQQRLLDAGLLLIRLIIAVVFVYHGSQKLFGWFGGGGPSGTAEFMEGLGLPAPMISGIASGCVEFFGGIAVGLGLFTRIAAVLIALNMAVAILMVHRGAFGSSAGGMEYPLTLGVVAIGLALTGPGRLSLIRLWRRERTTP